MLLAWGKRHDRRFYNPKMFALVDSKNLEIYADGPVINRSDVVKKLVEPIHGTGRNITAGNWLTDLDLVKYLKPNGLSYVGAMNKNMVELPLNFVVTKNRSSIKSTFY